MKCEPQAEIRRSTNEEAISLEQMGVPVLTTITSINGSLNNRSIICILCMKGITSIYNGPIRIKYHFLRNVYLSISLVSSPLTTQGECVRYYRIQVLFVLVPVRLHACKDKLSTFNFEILESHFLFRLDVCS
jgi:hypothetical protein